MKRLLKSWVFWAFVAVPVAAGLLFFVVRVRDAYYCARCFSERTVTYWGVGTETRVHFLPLRPSVSEAPSRLRREILGDTHPHDEASWVLREFSASPLVGTRFGVTLNRSALSARIAFDYETSEPFREFLVSKPRAEVVDVLRHAVTGQGDPGLGVKGDAWRNEFFGSMPP